MAVIAVTRCVCVCACVCVCVRVCSLACTFLCVRARLPAVGTIIHACPCVRTAGCTGAASRSLISLPTAPASRRAGWMTGTRSRYTRSRPPRPVRRARAPPRVPARRSYARSVSVCACVPVDGCVFLVCFFVSVRDESVGVVAGTNASLTLVGSMYTHRNKVLDCRWTSEDRCVRACGCAWLCVRGCARVCVFGLCACAALCCVLACPFLFVCVHARGRTFTRAPLLQRRVLWRPARVRA